MKTNSRDSLRGGWRLIAVAIFSVFLITAAVQDTAWAQWSSKSRKKAQPQPVEKVDPIRLQVGATSLTAGDETKFSVTGGKEPITVKTNNDYIVSIKQDGQRAGIITGKGQGSAELFASDAGGMRASVRIEVKAPQRMSVYLDRPSIQAGQEARLTVTGGVKPYHIQLTCGDCAAVEQKDPGTFAVKGASAGATQIIVQDGLGKKMTLGLTITIPPLTASIDKSNIRLGQSAWVDVKGGFPPYKEVDHSYYVRVTQTQPDRFFVKSDRYDGSGGIVFQDSKGQKVTVYYNIYRPVRTTSTQYELYIGGETRNASLLVADGVPPYSVSDPSGITKISNPAARISLPQGVRHGQYFAVSGVKEGMAELIAKDGMGEVAKQRLKVTKRDVLVKRCMPDKSTYALGEKFTCTATGGKKPYYVIISPPGLGSAKLTGPDSFTIQVGRQWKGTMWITIQDSIKQFVKWQVQVK